MNMKLKTMLRVLMTGVAVIPVIIMMLVGSFSVMGYSSGMLAEDAGAVAYAQSSAVSAIMNEYFTDIKSISGIGDIITAAQGNYTEVSGTVDSTIANQISGGNNVLDLVIMDKDGLVIKDNAGTSQTDHFFGFDAFQDVDKDSIYTSKLYLDNETYGESVFFVAKQIREDSDTDGYIAEVVSIKAIQNYLQNTGFMTDGKLLVVDPDGTVIGFDKNEDGYPQITRSGELSNTGLQDKINSIKGNLVNTSNQYEEISAGGLIGGYNNIADTSWLWVGIYPSSNATSAVLPIVLIGLGMLVVILAAEMFIMVMETRHIINPITHMIKAMKEIKEGDKDTRLSTNGRGQFARMSATFNDMMEDVVLSEELHRTVSNISDNMLFEWDFNKELLYVSDNFSEKFDIDTKSATLINGKFLDSLMDADNAEKYKKDINTLLKTRDQIGSEYIIKTKSGKDVWFSIRIHCVTDRLGELLRVIGVLTDIDADKNAELELSERASYDFLSQLYNRSTFERELQQELDRMANSKVAIMFIDVDDFKFINDRFGHAVGDEVIKFVSDKIKKRVEVSGFAGRFGGDEFVMCINNKQMIEDIENVAMELIDDLYSGYYSEPAGTNINVRASIGIAISPENGKDSNTLVGAADEAMYFVKKNGKANYHFYCAEDSEQIEMQHSM